MVVVVPGDDVVGSVSDEQLAITATHATSAAAHRASEPIIVASTASNMGLGYGTEHRADVVLLAEP